MKPNNPAAFFSFTCNLFNVAKWAAKGSENHDRNPLVAIVFSVMWFEAFFQEAVMQAEYHRSLAFKIPKKLQSALIAFNELPERLPLSSRVQLLSCLLTGKPIAPGEAPFQEFALLVKLRNEIVHLRPHFAYQDDGMEGFVRRDSKGLTKALRDRGFLTEAGQRIGNGWADVIFNREAGLWAFETVVQMATTVANMFPAGRYRSLVHSEIIDSAAYNRALQRSKPLKRPV